MTTKFNRHDIVRHVKTGNLYYIVATPDTCCIEADNSEAYAYEELAGQDKKLWVRPKPEMEDGRFVKDGYEGIIGKFTVSELISLCPFESPEVSIRKCVNDWECPVLAFYGTVEGKLVGAHSVIHPSSLMLDLESIRSEMEHYVNQEESK